MVHLSYFRYAIGLSLLMLAGVYYVDRSFPLLQVVLTLGILEIAVSFDNAIVNVKVMQRMSPFWRHMFITVGIFIAVIGMRFYLPIQIVSSLGGVSLVDASRLAFTDPAKFAEILISSHVIVSGFGGAFLMMIFLKYFVDADRDESWLPGIETGLHHLGKVSEVQILITIVSAGVVAYITNSVTFFLAAIAGITSHIAVDIIKHFLTWIEATIQARREATNPTISTGNAVNLATGGLGMLLYLELFDASMSFDGVIAAFAITNNILVVAAGLGIGAVFVRSLTLMLFDTGSLAEYRYLESGAFWAIGGLSVFMFIGVISPIPDWVISGYGGLVIVIAFIHSVIANRHDAKEAGLGLSKASEARVQGAIDQAV